MAVQKSMYTTLDIPVVSFPDLVLQKAKEHGTRTALIDAHTGSSLSFRDVADNIRRFAGAMYTRGLCKGDVIMVFSPNHVLYPIVLIGAGYIGGITALVNNNYTADELRYMIEETQPVYFFTMSNLLDTVSKAIQGYSNIKGIFVFDESPRAAPVTRLLLEGTSHYLSPVVINPKEDILVLPFSSGTTGRSKGVMLTHYNLVANTFQTLHPLGALGSNCRQTHICFLPLYHIYGISVIVGPDLVKGHCAVVIEKFDLEFYLKTIEKYKATLLHVVPPVALQLAKSPIARQYDLSSVGSFYCGAAPLGPEVEREVIKLTGVPKFIQAYGMTEAGPNTHIGPMEGSVHGSCGRLIPNTECKIVDINTGHILGPNDDGELLIRGPQIMKGYWKHPAATQQTVDDQGFLHTGDIGHYDEEGNYYVVDRLKELIKWKGLQVAPADVEHVLLKHPDVADAAVVGIPDQEAGEIPKAYVVVKPGHNVQKEEIIKFVADTVSPHKRLRGGVEFVSEIPKSPSGKILRRSLREQSRKVPKPKL